MKRTTSPLTLIITLLFLMLNGMPFVYIAVANPIMFYDLPTKPDTNPPSVTLISPVQNQTFDSQNITLNFMVTKPATWVRPSEGKFVNGSKIYYVLGNITSFHYEIDEVKSPSVLVQDISTVYLAVPKRILSFSMNLTLPKGQHTICVGVEGETLYRQGGDPREPLASNMVYGASGAINFNIGEKPETEPFPTAFVAVVILASVVAVSTGLLFYFKKGKR